MNQCKERIKRLRDKYNAEMAASLPFYDEPEYTAHLPFPPDDNEHVGACASIVADASVWRKPITTVEELIDYAATRMSAN